MKSTFGFQRSAAEQKPEISSDLEYCRSLAFKTSNLGVCAAMHFVLDKRPMDARELLDWQQSKQSGHRFKH